VTEIRSALLDVREPVYHILKAQEPPLRVNVTPDLPRSYESSHSTSKTRQSHGVGDAVTGPEVPGKCIDVGIFTRKERRHVRRCQGRECWLSHRLLPSCNLPSYSFWIGTTPRAFNVAFLSKTFISSLRLTLSLINRSIFEYNLVLRLFCS
jgi:hypothetical protein